MEIFGTEEHQDREYFMDDKTLPIHRKGVRSGVFTKDILNEMIAHNGAMATRVPLGVNMNALFFIDTKKLGHYKDVLSDGCGVWRQTKTKVHYFKLLEERITEVDEMDAVCEDQNTGTSFKVTRLSYRHSSSADFHRIVIFAFKYTGNEMFEIISPLALQYYFENEEHKVIPRPHGNHKKGKVFQRTFKSVKNKIRNELDSKTPNQQK